MSKSAATLAFSCRLHIGGFCAALAILVLLPSGVLAADPEPALRRSDKIDVHRLGKVSEDERSVLRIEWRAGLAGIEETRSVQEMLDNLHRLETTIGEVSRLVRSMPVQSPGVATTAAVAATVPATAETPDSSGYDFRLAVANLAALALVALWWFRRRKPVIGLETTPAPSSAIVPPVATLPTASPPIPAPLAKTDLTGAAPAEAPPDVPSAAAQKSVTATPPQSGSSAPQHEPVAARAEPKATSDPAPVTPAATAEPVAATSFSPPETKPSEPFPADKTPTIDFSLEEADPDVVARENAKLQALSSSISPPKPAQTRQTQQETNVEPTLQLAEIMLSMGLEQGAAQALIEYIEAHPRHAVYHWLKLLGIYRSRGLQKEFTETAEKLRLHFNIQAEDWGKPAEGEAPRLENFSRVSEHVQKIWSQPKECITYLRRLLEDNREGARAGFPQSVAEEILFLVEVLKENTAA